MEEGFLRILRGGQGAEIRGPKRVGDGKGGDPFEGEVLLRCEAGVGDDDGDESGGGLKMGTERDFWDFDQLSLNIFLTNQPVPEVTAPMGPGTRLRSIERLRVERATCDRISLMRASI